MRVLVHSPAFLPKVGGLEINVATLARAFVEHGHEVVVWTTTPADPNGSPPLPFGVARKPSPLAVLRLMRWCDVFMHANVSLRGAWPLLLLRRPWVVSHHSWYCRSDGRILWQDRLKRWAVGRADASLAVSLAIADDLEPPAQLIPNAYRDDLFRVLPGIARDRDLVFVGRLVSDKGVDVLLRALARLAEAGMRPRLDVIGEGPERPALERQVGELGLTESVHFLGIRTGMELVELLNRYRVMVVPSTYDEPFGIVALEGIACGCVVVATSGGGLPEAVGPCGVVVANGDSEALAAGIQRVLADENLRRELLEAAPPHLALHTVRRVSESYLAVLHAIRAAEACH